MFLFLGKYSFYFSICFTRFLLNILLSFDSFWYIRPPRFLCWHIQQAQNFSLLLFTSLLIVQWVCWQHSLLSEKRLTRALLLKQAVWTPHWQNQVKVCVRVVSEPTLVGIEDIRLGHVAVRLTLKRYSLWTYKLQFTVLTLRYFERRFYYST